MSRFGALQGNFAPVSVELENVVLETTPGMTDTLPADLDGVYVRAGPNPVYTSVPNMHWFDGDGMHHAFDIRGDAADGTVIYTNRWVRTRRFLIEALAGKPVFVRLSDIGRWEMWRKMAANFVNNALGWLVGRPKYSVMAVTLPSGRRVEAGEGSANTAVEFHAGRMLALVESDFPYHVSAPRLETIERVDFNGALTHAMSAHPKVDGDGRMYAFGYRIGRPGSSNVPSFYAVSRISPSGTVEATAELLSDFVVPTMVHDCAISQSFFVIFDLPLFFDGRRIARGQRPMVFDPQRHPTRFGLLSKDFCSGVDPPVQWFSAQACYMFHSAAAFEHPHARGKTVLIGCRAPTVDLYSLLPENSDAPAQTAAVYQPHLHLWIFDRETGTTTEHIVDAELQTEFPRIADAMVGAMPRSIYAAVLDPASQSPVLTGLVKYAVTATEDGSVTVVREHHLQLPKGMTCGEPAFAPRSPSRHEDDGYLLTVVHDEASQQSSLWIFDATNLSVLCKYAAPQRVPYGFHGKWIPRKWVNEQVHCGAKSDVT